MPTPRPLQRSPLRWAGCGRLGGWILPLVLLHGCSGPETVDPLAAPMVVIPLVQPVETGGNSARDAYYRNIVMQLQEAAQEGDRARLESLLAVHDIPAAPAWSKPILADFRARVTGLRLADWLAAAGRMRMWEGAPEGGGAPPAESRDLFPLGTAKTVELSIGGLGSPLPDGLQGCALRGTDRAGEGGAGPATFAVTVTLEDMDAAGNVRERRGSRVLRLARTTPLDGGLVQRMEVDAEAGDAVLREIRVRVELLPGAALRDGQPLPHDRVLVGEGAWLAAPRGADAIRRHPMRALRRALNVGSPGALPAVILACSWMPMAEREVASALLVDVVRNGTSSLARGAMVGLQQMHGAELPLGDRDAWLRWWSRRAR